MCATSSYPIADPKEDPDDNDKFYADAFITALILNIKINGFV